MTAATLDLDEPRLSVAIWRWLRKYSPHYDCGGWTWDSREPRVLLCACNQNLMATGATPC